MIPRSTESSLLVATALTFQLELRTSSHANGTIESSCHFQSLRVSIDLDHIAVG